jgi:hypothetical protein
MFLHFKGRNTEITEETQRCAEIFEVFLRVLCESSVQLCVTLGTRRAQRRHRDAQRGFERFFLRGLCEGSA